MWLLIAVFVFAFLMIGFTALIQIMASGLLLEIAGKTIRKDTPSWKLLLVFVGLVLIGVGALMLEILIWAYIMFWTGQFRTWQEAVSFCADKFTTLGSMDPLPEPWAVLGPIITINGIIMFSIVAASLFTTLSSFYHHELKRKRRERDRLRSLEQGDEMQEEGRTQSETTDSEFFVPKSSERKSRSSSSSSRRSSSSNFDREDYTFDILSRGLSTIDT